MNTTTRKKVKLILNDGIISAWLDKVTDGVGNEVIGFYYTKSGFDTTPVTRRSRFGKLLTELTKDELSDRYVVDMYFDSANNCD